MKILDIFKNWFSKKNEVELKVSNEVVPQQQNTNTVNETDLQIEIKRLNSRISFMTEKVEKMTKQQEEMLCQMEQVLFHTSGSFVPEEINIRQDHEIKINNIKNMVNIGDYSQLN